MYQYGPFTFFIIGILVTELGSVGYSHQTTDNMMKDFRVTFNNISVMVPYSL